MGHATTSDKGRESIVEIEEPPQGRAWESSQTKGWLLCFILQTASRSPSVSLACQNDGMELCRRYKDKPEQKETLESSMSTSAKQDRIAHFEMDVLLVLDDRVIPWDDNY